MLVLANTDQKNKSQSWIVIQKKLMLPTWMMLSWFDTCQIGI